LRRGERRTVQSSFFSNDEYGVVTYYILFFVHLETRGVDIAGITVHSGERWMQQIARNVTMEGVGALQSYRHLLHDRDTKYSESKEECWSKLILFGERSLRRALSEYNTPYHAERNHQAKATCCCFRRSLNGIVDELSDVAMGSAGSAGNRQAAACVAGIDQTG
jgi:hypothetical protein